MGLINNKVFSIGEITREIKLSLENRFSGLWIEGEISNFKRHTSGHLYFSLKDSQAALRCVMWRGTASHLSFEPEDGTKVRAFGDITIYEKQGNYQLRVAQMLPLGVGELEIAFRKLKERLAAEGLFDPEHKTSLPEIPQTVGVITSPTGAAVRDIIVTLHRRWPPARIVLCPTAVQGAGAAAQIAEAVKDFNAWGQADVLIVGRGGGSLEDLWPFNEEIVARAVYNSQIPVVSAVGHEIDFTICDFVADVRAPTPTGAAELVVPDREEMSNAIRNMVSSMSLRIGERLRQYREIIKGFKGRYGMKRIQDIIFQSMQRVDELERGLTAAMRHTLDRSRTQVDYQNARLQALSPQAVLKRGYSVTRTYPEGQVVSTASSVRAGRKIQTVLAEGGIISEVIEVHHGRTDGE